MSCAELFSGGAAVALSMLVALLASFASIVVSFAVVSTVAGSGSVYRIELIAVSFVDGVMPFSCLEQMCLVPSLQHL